MYTFVVIAIAAAAGAAWLVWDRRPRRSCYSAGGGPAPGWGGQMPQQTYLSQSSAQELGWDDDDDWDDEPGYLPSGGSGRGDGPGEIGGGPAQLGR